MRVIRNEFHDHFRFRDSNYCQSPSVSSAFSRPILRQPRAPSFLTFSFATASSRPKTKRTSPRWLSYFTYRYASSSPIVSRRRWKTARKMAKTKREMHENQSIMNLVCFLLRDIIFRIKQQFTFTVLFNQPNQSTGVNLNYLLHNPI